MPETQEVPKYRLIAPIYFDDQFIPETMIIDGRETPTIIEFEELPNEAMEPVNEPARKRFAEYEKMMEASMVAAGRLSRKIEDIVAQEVAARPREPRGTVELPQVRAGVPVMGNVTAEGGKKLAPEKGTVKIMAEAQSGPAPIKVGGPKEG